MLADSCISCSLLNYLSGPYPHSDWEPILSPSAEGREWEMLSFKPFSESQKKLLI